jgi:hypothetical protein
VIAESITNTPGSSAWGAMMRMRSIGKINAVLTAATNRLIQFKDADE